MNDVIRYTATTASDNVEDMFDADNFYPYDGLGDVYDEDEWGSFSGLDADGEGLDIEYSEAFGDFVKKIGQGVKGLASKFKERGGGRSARRSKRSSRRADRRMKRQERRNRRQMELVKGQPLNVQQNIEKIVTESTPENPTLRVAVEKTAAGVATPPEEQATTVVVQEAQKMAATGETTPPKITPTNEVQDSWWSKLPMGGKIGIIGGGVVVLGLGIWGLTSLGKK
jgi:hypothetical protein